MPGYVRKDRAELARWLASADIYVSGMADETFGVSIVEAQASGLPVVGVAAGAMIDRVTDTTRSAWPGRRCRRRWPRTSWRCGTAIARAMADEARAHALQFSWDSSMEALFSRVYPAAFGARREREQVGAAPAAAAQSRRLIERTGGHGRALRQRWSKLAAGHRAGARAQPIGLHFLRHADLSRRRAAKSR